MAKISYIAVCTVVYNDDFLDRPQRFAAGSLFTADADDDEIQRLLRKGAIKLANPGVQPALESAVLPGENGEDAVAAAVAAAAADNTDVAEEDGFGEEEVEKPAKPEKSAKPAKPAKPK